MLRSIKYLNNLDSLNINNKTILITGGNSGIGLSFAKLASFYGANLILAVRNLEKGEIAKQEILKLNPNTQIQLLKLDLADFNSIDNFVNNIVKNKIDIDCFYNNAGIYRIKDQLTKQGHEIVMGTNLFGTYYLTIKILNYLRELDHKVDYILTSSIAGIINKIDINNLYKNKTTSIKYYGSTKRGIIHLYTYLLDKYKNTNIDVSIVHPGVTYTGIVSKGFNSKIFVKLAKIFMSIFCHSSYQASLPTFKALIKPGFYGPRALFGIKGLPKEIKLKNKWTKGYNETISYLNDIVNAFKKE